jgi:hypothetical protein
MLHGSVFGEIWSHAFDVRKRFHKQLNNYWNSLDCPLSLKVAAALEIAWGLGFLPSVLQASLRIFFKAVGFSPLGGLRKAKQIALLASSICAMSDILVARWGRKVVNTVAGESKLHNSRRNVPIISHVFVCVL